MIFRNLEAREGNTVLMEFKEGCWNLWNVKSDIAWRITEEHFQSMCSRYPVERLL